MNKPLNKNESSLSLKSINKLSLEKTQYYYQEDGLSSTPTDFKIIKSIASSSIKIKKNTQPQLVCVQNKEEFKVLKEKWNNLLSDAENTSPFMLWEWMFTWWEIFENNNDSLFILTLYDDQTLLAVAPFYIKKGFRLANRLGFLGEGEKNSDAIVTHYPDILVSEDNRELAVEEIAKFLKNDIETKRSFHYAFFDLIKPDAVIHDISRKLSDTLALKQEPSGNQFVISLPSSEEAYFSSLSKSVRKQFRLKRNRLEKLGNLELKTEKNLSEALVLVEKLHRARWDGITPTSVFDSAPFTRFHKKLCGRLSNQDIVNIRTMYLNGEAIVSAYNFNYKNINYSYLSGFSSQDDNRLSPMFIFDLLELKGLIRAGCQSFDLLVSESDNNYKSRFGSKIVPCEKVSWMTNSPSSFVLKSYFFMKPYLSNIYNKYKK